MRRLFVLLGVAGLLAAVASEPGAGSAPTARSAQEAANCAGQIDLANGSFEDPATVSAFSILDQSKVPGWSTTEPDGKIEIWQSGYLGVPAANGEQFAELSANEPGELYQDRPTVPGTRLTYVVNHRGRSGVDTMEIRIGPPGEDPTLSRVVSTGNTDWQQVFGEYFVPPGQTNTRFGFAAVENASGNPSIGNFLDGVVFSAARCSITVSKRLFPASDPGRFNLLVADEIVASSAGDGDTSGPVSTPLDTVRVSEQGAAGTNLARYASTTRCRDNTSREIVAQAIGPAATVRFDRPRDVSCTIRNLPATAIVLEKVFAPGRDAGRFNLRVNGRRVARTAGNHTVAGPVGVDPGTVTVSERAARGTDPSAHASAIQCKARAGRGDVVAAAQGKQVSFTVGPRALVRCVLLNVKRPSPSPSPAPSPTPPSPPAPAPEGQGELDLVTRTSAIERRVADGARTHFRIRVRNRGPAAATNVRIIPFLRQGLVRAGAVSLSPAADEGACVATRGGGLCHATTIAPGEHVTISVRATARPGSLAPVRLVAAARADELETVVANNLDRSRIRVVQPETCPRVATARVRRAC